ncbi:MAG: hypothetical protein OES79_16825 [Planctomycetota bacterium]|nr:hypothetical protein [Planctomycetota bacterium]
MTTVFFDSHLSEDDRRERLYAGDLFVYSSAAASRDLCEFARVMICEAFDDDDPETVQSRLDVGEYVEILKDLKPRFIHHQKSKEYVRGILESLGCNLDETYFDVPRLRSSTSDGYLTTGIAYAWHPHRDTWYSAPKSQINIWMPIYPLRDSNTVAFHPAHFDKIVQNDSAKYNYYEWNSKYRAAASSQVSKDTRPLPAPTDEVERESEIRVVCPVGGLILFSGAQLHSSVENTSGVTRFSIDFRVVNADDIRAGQGAPTSDVQCTGSNIRDFLRADDFGQIDNSIVDLFNDGTEASGDLVYRG